MNDDMSPVDWGTVKHFMPFDTTDVWGNPFKVKKRLVITLEEIRRHVNRPVHVHCAYQQRDKPSWHSNGRAADIHIEGFNVLEQFVVVTRWDVINGIGVYPWWRNPGLHIDLRPRGLRHSYDARWGSPAPGEYVPLTGDFILESF